MVGNQTLLSSNIGDPPTGLCKAIDDLIEKPCSEKISSNSLEIFLAGGLIPLEIPGVQPTGVGNVLRLITGKVDVSALQEDAISLRVSVLICAGDDVGYEAAGHAIHFIFKDSLRLFY